MYAVVNNGVQVYIENQQKGQMTWLGGYRNKKTGSHFLHATCQTDRKPKVYEKDRQFTRETQVRAVLCEEAGHLFAWQVSDLASPPLQTLGLSSGSTRF